ncbi:MAG: exodeoxyribonuclease V subunit gamma [Parachlamydiales bacterium]|nr:exodeoxyribonuclease V subunit gamma [Candidatus Acheromyda pituitae]
MFRGSRYYSNEQKILAQRMGADLFSSRTAPFENRLVIVPSAPIKEFLSAYFARHPNYNIFAGVRVMPLAEGFLELLASINFEKQLRIPSMLELSILIEQLICQAVHASINKDRKELQPLLEYIGQEFSTNNSSVQEKRIASLSAHLSKLFSRYGLYGESFLDDWVKEKGWQQWIWNNVYAEGSGWTYPIKSLKHSLDRASVAAQVHVFGFSSMPKLYLEFFNRLGCAFYLLSPCAMFWEDLATDRERIGARRHLEKIQIKETDVNLWEQYLRDTNPLLANLGKTGREFLKLIEEADLDSDDHYEDPGRETLLARLQNDLLYLRNPKEIGGDENSAPDDSLQVHSAPSLLREVELLYNQLCDLISMPHPGKAAIEPKDVLVLAPDLNLYAPFIQTVFGSKDSVLSFSLEGVADSAAKELFEAVLHLISMPEQQFSKESVLELLTFSSFREKWQLSSDDAAKVRRWVDSANIRFGKWESGLDRLIFGTLMKVDEESALEMPFELWPCSGVEISDLDLLGKLIQLIRSLREDLKPVTENQKRSLPSWLDFIEMLVSRYFEPLQGQEALLMEISKLRSHFPSSELSVFGVATMARILQTLSDSQTGSMFSHNAQKITFRPLKSGNITEGQVIWLLGVDEGSFPRTEPASSLNEMRSHKDQDFVPKRIDEDRYLFLECATLAKQHLAFSYQRLDPQDNKEKAPSLIVQEILQYIDNRVAVIHHPAISFDSRYFSSAHINGPALPSFSKRQFECAQAFYFGSRHQEPFFCNSLDIQKSDEKAQERVIDIKHLKELARNPIRFHFRQSLKMYMSSEEDEDGDFLISALSRSIFRKTLLKRSLKTQEKVWQEQGKLPVGVFGEAAMEALEEEVSDLKEILSVFHIGPEQIFSVELSLLCTEPFLQKTSKWILPALQVPMPDGSLVHLVGSLDDLTPRGLIFHGEDKLHDWVKSWPLLLVLGCLQDLPFSVEKSLLLSKKGAVKEGCFSNYPALMQQYISYYERALLDLSPLMPDWIANILTDSEAGLEKNIGNSLKNDRFEDPDLQWLKRRNALPDAKQCCANWSEYARTLFGPMLDVWGKGGANAAD